MDDLIKAATAISSLFSSQNEWDERAKLISLFRHCPIPDEHLLRNLGLFMNRQSLMRVLFFNELYSNIINTHGSIMELGVRWGQNLALFESFRGMYEPYNLSRKIIGFDTFEGFPSIHDKDGSSEHAAVGEMAVTAEYKEYLEGILDYHETESPIAHIKKYEIIQGDASVTVVDYLKQHPETLIALVYFDMDIYEPTKNCLEAIKPHLVKGSVIGFDELNNPVFPGETVAFQEVFGANNCRLQQSKFSAAAAYMAFE